MVSFKRPSLERKKELPFPLGVLVCADGQGRGRKLFCFCLVSPGEVATAAAQLGPQTPFPHYVAGGARPQTAFRIPPQRRCAVTRWHALCSQDCFLLSLLDLPALQPSAPTPVFPARILPAGRWPGAELGRPPPTGWL